MEYEMNCTLIIGTNKLSLPNANEMQKKLENDENKEECMKELILGLMDPDTAQSYSKLLMTVIRFVVPTTNCKVKRLLMLYFEIAEKCKPDGSLKEEMILVCNALRNDLISSNEFVRGCTLRLLCKMPYQRILEPLLEPISLNLSHRHSYVRRNAIMCHYAIIQKFGTDMLPNATEEIEKLLLLETDLSAKRNAFLVLLHCDYERALNYALSVQDSVTCIGDIFQLVLLEMLRKFCRINPLQKSAAIRIIINIVRSSPPAVCYDGALSLVSLTEGPLAIKTASEALVDIIIGQQEINVKLIMLRRLRKISTKYPILLEGIVLDLLRVLSCPSIEVRARCLDIILKLLTERNIVSVLQMLIRQLNLSKDAGSLTNEALTQNLEYRRILIRAIHFSCKCFPDTAQLVLHVLMDIIVETDAASTVAVANFIRDIAFKNQSIRPILFERILDALPDLKKSKVIRTCLWILGEFCEDAPTIMKIINSVYNALEPFPLELAEEENKDFSANQLSKREILTRTVVLDDGTYGTEDLVDSKSEIAFTFFRNTIINGEILLSSTTAVALTKLIMKEPMVADKIYRLPNNILNRAMYIVASLLNLNKGCSKNSFPAFSEITARQCVRISCCLRSLLLFLHPKSTEETRRSVSKLFLSSNTEALKNLVDAKISSYDLLVSPLTSFKPFAFSLETFADEMKELITKYEADDTIRFRQFENRQDTGCSSDIVEDDETDIRRALGSGSHLPFPSGPTNQGDGTFEKRLEGVKQLTGLADPLYVEAFFQVHMFDLVVELLIINHTNETIQNIHVELSTQGELRLVERPLSGFVLREKESITLKAVVKVQSTETGLIFGYVTFDKKASLPNECLVLNEISVDLLDFVQKSWIDELPFRTKWSQFEWENRITICTPITDIEQFLMHIIRSTNMTIVSKGQRPKISPKNNENHFRKGKTDDSSNDLAYYPELLRLARDSSFFAVNLYSRSMFGEDALANVSVEKMPNGKLNGTIRIRSRSQGIALSLGDRISVVQRSCVSKKN